MRMLRLTMKLLTDNILGVDEVAAKRSIDLRELWVNARRRRFTALLRR
jgi:hypothetical protein